MSVAPLSSAYGKAESCKPAGRAHWIGKVELDTRHQTTVQGQSKKQNKDGQSLASLFCSPHAGVSSVAVRRATQPAVISRMVNTGHGAELTSL